MEGDYEEEWEADEPSVDKKNVILSIGGQVYPLVGDENTLTRDAELTRLEVSVLGFHVSPTEHDIKEEELKANIDEADALDVFNTSEENLASDHEISNVENEKTYTTCQLGSDTDVSSDTSNVIEDHHLLEIRIHGQHYNNQTSPLIPGQVSTLSPDTHREEPASIPDVGELQARIAAKRVVDFRRRQELKAEEQREQESLWAQKRREIRRSNDKMYKALGVAGLSSQDHLRLAQHRSKQKAKETEMLVSRDRQNRWYNNIPKRTVSASDHIQELNKQFNRVKREQQEIMQHKQKYIQANQLELKRKARAEVNKGNGGYVRGSYLLRVRHHTINTEKKTSEIEKKAETE